MGVTSSIRPIFMAERASARRADWAPGPGVFVLFPPVARSLICKAVIPSDLHFSATSCIKNTVKSVLYRYETWFHTLRVFVNRMPRMAVYDRTEENYIIQFQVLAYDL
jgi:hypothetical protein